MSDETPPTKRERIAKHLKENKNKYLISLGGIGCLAIGGAVGWKLQPEVVANITAKNTSLLSYKPEQSIIQETIIELASRGERGHVIIDGAGNIVGSSIKEAARNEGMSRGTMQDVLRGLREVAPNGKTYKDLGENLSEQVKVSV